MTTPSRRANPSSSPDALLLDEMYSPRIAALLIARHVDCIAVADDEVLRATDDETVLLAALAQQRVLVTNNVVDFEPLRALEPPPVCRCRR